MKPDKAAVFPDPLQVTALDMENGKRKWRLDTRFRGITSLGEIEVPKAFTTDLASVPRFLWAAFSPADEYLEAAIIHDWLYSEHNDRFTRKQADGVMLELMFNLGVAWHRRHAVHTAVRLFGGSSWQANA